MKISSQEKNIEYSHQGPFFTYESRQLRLGCNLVLNIFSQFYRFPTLKYRLVLNFDRRNNDERLNVFLVRCQISFTCRFGYDINNIFLYYVITHYFIIVLIRTLMRKSCLLFIHQHFIFCFVSG